MKKAFDTVARPSRILAGACVGLILTSISTISPAGEFGVRVIDELGEPVPGASVCIGLEGNYTQFGTAFTDLDGNIPMVDVPNVPFIVTVSKTRFTGLRMSEPALGLRLIKEVRLATGNPGPRCRADSSLAELPNAPVIRIRAMDIRSSDGRTTLTPVVTGGPREYRIADNDGFFGADWQGYDGQIAMPSELSSLPSVYLQLRRFEGSSTSWLEARSDAIKVDLGEVN